MTTTMMMTTTMTMTTTTMTARGVAGAEATATTNANLIPADNAMNRVTSPTRRRRTFWRSGPHRAGAAAVEFAIVAPIAFLIIFGFVEFGRAFFALHALEEAARAGCRVAILKDATSSEVQTAVTNILTPCKVSGQTVTTTPTSPATARQWDPVTVSVSVSYRNISWLPTPRFLANKTISASCTLPKEGDQ
jgi:Flp pilus assembly protein TadG